MPPPDGLMLPSLSGDPPASDFECGPAMELQGPCPSCLVSDTHRESRVALVWPSRCWTFPSHVMSYHVNELMLLCTSLNTVSVAAESSDDRRLPWNGRPPAI